MDEVIPRVNDATPGQDFEVNLVERMIEGDTTAEEEMVAKFGRGVMFYLRKEVRDAQAAQDLYQETFRIGIEKIRSQKLQNPGRLGAFLFGIARFVVRDYFRKGSKNESTLEPETVDRLPGPAVGPLSQLLRKDCSRQILEVLGTLKSDRDRQVIFRFYIAQDDKSDICRDLDLTSIHFNRVLHRARQRFKELLLKQGLETYP